MTDMGMLFDADPFTVAEADAGHCCERWRYSCKHLAHVTRINRHLPTTAQPLGWPLPKVLWARTFEQLEHEIGWRAASYAAHPNACSYHEPKDGTLGDLAIATITPKEAYL